MRSLTFQGYSMPLSVDDVTYYTLTEVAELVGRRRETVWRWMRAGKIPQGQRYRDKERLFTESEKDQVHAHAHRLEPIEAGDSSQLGLFMQGEGTG